MNLIELSPNKSIDFENECYASVDLDHFWACWRFHILTHSLDKYSSADKSKFHGLEIGGGNGLVRKQLEDHYDCKIDICDINEKALAQCYEGKGDIYHYDILERQDSMTGKYDLVTLFDVLEHIEDTGPFLAAVMTHLKPGGLIAINVPAYNFFFSAYDHALGHFRRYTTTTLRSEFNEMPSRILNLQYWGLSLLPLVAARSLIMPGRPRDAEHRADIVRRGLKPPSTAFNNIMQGVKSIETNLTLSPPAGSSVFMLASNDD